MIKPYKKGRYTHLFFSSHGKEHKINMFKLRGALGLLKEEGTGISPVGQQLPFEARFLYPNNGYPADKKVAKKYLKVGKSYAIDKLEEGDWHTTLWLKEFPKVGFNSVLFEIIGQAKVVEKECEHNWEYSSPPHRDQRCKKCGQHRIEPEAKSSGMSELLSQAIYETKYSELSKNAKIDTDAHLLKLRTYLKDKLKLMKKSASAYVGDGRDRLMAVSYNQALTDVLKSLEIEN